MADSEYTVVNKWGAVAPIYTVQEATPLELMQALMDRWGKQWISWEPETVWRNIWAAKPDEMPLVNREKIMAIKGILASDGFWKDWGVFEKTTLALNNIPPRFDILEHVYPSQMAYAVRVASDLIRFPGATKAGKERIFSSEVKSYIAGRAFLEGVVYLPDPLTFAQAKLDDMSGEGKLAKAIAVRANTPEATLDETPEGIGAMRAIMIRHYAFDNHRKGHL